MIAVTFKSVRIFIRTKKQDETFHATLIAQVGRSKLGTLEDESVRDVFISKMRIVDTSLEEVLKRAIKFEHCN